MELLSYRLLFAQVIGPIPSAHHQSVIGFCLEMARASGKLKNEKTLLLPEEDAYLKLDAHLARINKEVCTYLLLSCLLLFTHAFL